MLPGLLWWGAGYVALALGLPVAGRTHPLPGYALYLGVCLLPLNVLAFLAALRRPAGDRLAFVVQGCAILAVTYPVHILTTLATHWAYFEDRDALVGIRVGGIPVEEFFFYPFTINLAVWLYGHLAALPGARRGPPPRWLGWACRGGALAAFAVAGWVWFGLRQEGPAAAATRFRDAVGNPHYAEGVRDYGWTLVCLVSVGCNLLTLEQAARRTALAVRSLVPLAPVFFIICFLADLLGTSRGWWVFNDMKVSGWWIGPVPAEDLPMYLTGITLPLALYEGMRRWARA